MSVRKTTHDADEFRPSELALLIEAARRAKPTSVRQAASWADISESRWRQIAKGYQQVTKEVRAPVNAATDTLVRMATAVDLRAADVEKLIARSPSEDEQLASVLAQLKEKESLGRNPGPVFGGSYEDPDYLASVEEWVMNLQDRLAEAEDRISALEDRRDADQAVRRSGGGGKPSQFDHDLAAHEGFKGIPADEEPAD